jgi:nucleotide-binding universal stress UspA family protein
MIPIHAILHPTDFSEHANAALGLARSLAREHGARLFILHVVPEQGFAHGMLAVPTDPRLYGDELEEVRRKVEGPDLKHPVETHLRYGEAAAEIDKAAEEFHCDLIVMGSHGRTGLGRLLMGSVAEAVMRGTSLPVLILKSGAPAPVEREVPGVVVY